MVAVAGSVGDTVALREKDPAGGLLGNCTSDLVPPLQCDEQILPALYAWVGEAFDATPTQLGNLALARAVVQALASPIGGLASKLPQ